MTVSCQKGTAKYVPAVRGNTYVPSVAPDLLGVKRAQTGYLESGKPSSSTEELLWKLDDLSAVERESGTPCVAVKCVDIWNTSGEGVTGL